jgi:hypothetical protein
MNLAPGQAINEVGINGAKASGSGTQLGMDLGVVIKEPLQFGSRKVRVDHQTRDFPDLLPVVCLNELLTDWSTSSAQPNNGAVKRLSGLSVKDNDGLPLIGNTQTKEVLCDGAIPLEHQLERRDCILVDLLRVVFDPTRLRILLFVVYSYFVD